MKDTKAKKYLKVPVDVSVHVRYLYQDLGVNGKELLKRYPQYSRASIYRHAKKRIGDVTQDQRRNNCGRPKLLSSRDERRILNQIPKLRKSMGSEFGLHSVREGASVCRDVSDTTVARVLYRHGYGFRRCRRKGILTENDLKARLKFAKHAKKTLSPDTWSKGNSFYLDGVGFTHKYNPCEHAKRSGTMTWRKRNEGLALHCTAKGAQEGNGGRVVKFMVTIAHSKGVTMCHHYESKLNRQSFADFIEKRFPACFNNSANREEKVFLKDGDPSQNSAVARDALVAIGGKKFSIPPRSPDLNPIENIFHLAKRKLRQQAITENINSESYEQFVKRISRTLKSLPVELIDKTIDSMNKRIQLVIDRKGQRTRY